MVDKNHQLRVLVTGANGFIGRALTDHLSKLSFQLVPCVRKLPKEREFDSLPFFECGDIHSSTNWKEALSGVDVVVHTAARVHIMSDKSSNSSDNYHRINVDASMNLALQASKAGVKRFIYLSSAKVNGESSALGNPFKSSDFPNPVGEYAISKFEAEQQLIKLSSETGLEVVIIRPPLVYGPGVKANFALLANIVRLGLPLPFGSITENLRSMVSLDNLIDFISLCLQHTAVANEVFMVSDGDDVSTVDLIKRIAKVYQRKIWLIPIPISILAKIANCLSKKDALDRLVGTLQVDIQKNFDLLNWKPKTTLDLGLQTALFSKKITNN